MQIISDCEVFNKIMNKQCVPHCIAFSFSLPPLGWFSGRSTMAFGSSGSLRSLFRGASDSRELFRPQMVPLREQKHVHPRPRRHATRCVD